MGGKKERGFPGGRSYSSLKLHSPCLWSEHSSGRPGSGETDLPCDHRFYLLPSQKGRAESGLELLRLEFKSSLSQN